MLRPVLALAAAFVLALSTGCGGESGTRVDTGSGEKLTASLEAMRKGMTPEQVAEFDADVMTFAF